MISRLISDTGASAGDDSHKAIYPEEVVSLVDVGHVVVNFEIKQNRKDLVNVSMAECSSSGKEVLYTCDGVAGLNSELRIGEQRQGDVIGNLYIYLRISEFRSFSVSCNRERCVVYHLAACMSRSLGVERHSRPASKSLSSSAAAVGSFGRRVAPAFRSTAQHDQLPTHSHLSDHTFATCRKSCQVCDKQ